MEKTEQKGVLSAFVLSFSGFKQFDDIFADTMIIVFYLTHIFNYCKLYY